MENRIIDVFKIANRMVSLTVEQPDLEQLRIGSFVLIGTKEYKVHSVPMFNGGSKGKIDTFTIDYTDDDLRGMQVYLN